jgi:hypothetical protein
VYAKLQWSWVYNSWSESHPTYIIIYGDQTLMQTRSGRPLGPKENARFEEIEAHMQAFMDTTEVDKEDFEPPYDWPELENHDDDESHGDPSQSYNDRVLLRRMREQAEKELLQRIKAREPSSPIEQPDEYYDCIFSQEAISQANWACANMASSRVCLFGGPVAVMIDKYESLLKKGCCMPELGLSNMYM